MYTEHPQIHYANLDDNDYSFEVQACNEWGVWSESASVNFSILAPFWETWWFRLLTLVFFMGIIAILIYWRIHQLIAVERVRAKIAADLHDDIGAGLSEINILSAVAEAKTPKMAKEYSKNELSKIAKVARQMIDDMSDIVWMIKPQKDSMTDLVSRLKDCYNDVLDVKGISFRFENSHLFKKIKLNMEQRQFIFLIFKEAINNAIKYSDCNEINLKISTERKKIIIILQDNGKGFDVKNIRRGNGLINMSQRAKKIKGEVDINSQINIGTIIKFVGKI
jgi:signal transduction histidine kinase